VRRLSPLLGLLFACSTNLVAAPQTPVFTDAEALAIHKRVMRGSQPGILLQRAGLTTGMVDMVLVPARLHPLAFADEFEELQWLFCGEAFAAVGRFGPASSHRADDDSAVFSVRRFSIEDVVRPNAVARHATGSDIWVLTSGGTVRINDRSIRSDTPDVGPGRHLAVFNGYVPASGAYIAGLWAYALPDSGRVVRVNLPQLPFIESLSQRQLISIAKKAAARLPASCNPRPIAVG